MYRNRVKSVFLTCKLLLAVLWLGTAAPWPAPHASLAQHPHFLSVVWVHGHHQMVLRHHDNHDAHGTPAHAATLSAVPGHADHILHSLTPDVVIAPTAPRTRAHAPLLALWRPGVSGIPDAPTVGCTHPPPLLSPTLASLRTTVLVV